MFICVLQSVVQIVL